MKGDLRISVLSVHVIHASLDMGSKTISLSEDAYRLLEKAKQPGESFSDVVKRVLRKRPLSSFAGSWAEMEEDEVEVEAIVEPDEGEKELFSRKVKEEEYSDWDTVKNEL